MRLHEDILAEPMDWFKPQRIFVCSMSDLFHADVPFEFIDRVFAVRAARPQHTFLALTKRPERMAEYLASRSLNIGYWDNAARGLGYSIRWEAPNGLPLSNVWLGTSCEDQATADERIPHLLRCPASVLFLSCEPLIGPVVLPDRFLLLHHLREMPHHRTPWVIVGGESGPGARPMHPDWARAIRDQCNAAGVAFFFKQFGSWSPNYAGDPPKADSLVVPDGRDGSGGFLKMWRVGKSAAGRELDGRTWDEMPETAKKG